MAKGNYYIAEVQVFVEGKLLSTEVVSGLGYNPNFVKSSAEDRIRQNHKGKRITSVILKKTDMDLEEYKKLTGGTPNWLGGPAADQ